MIIEAWGVPGSLGWYRMKLPLDEFATQGGHRVIIRSIGGQDDFTWPLPVWLASPGMRTADYEPDVLLVQWVYGQTPVNELRRLAGSSRTRVVYLLEDNIFGTGYFQDIEPEVRGMLPGVDLKNVLRRVFADNMRHADAVVVTTSPLARVVRRFNSNVHVIPNYIPASHLDYQRPATDANVVTYGWGGWNSHRFDFSEIAAPLGSYFRTHRNTEMHIMGYKNPELWDALPPAQRRWTFPTDHPVTYWRQIDFDVGLAPARRDDLNLSRSDAKALEYAAHGIPSVVSSVGECAQFVEHGRTGFVVSSPDEWAPAMEELMSPTVRAAMGRAARDKAAIRTIEANWEQWLPACFGNSDPKLKEAQ